jgi:hypothetical protein
MLLSGSRNVAMPAQQSCSIGSATNLIGRNGINKTLMWKKYVAVEEVRCSRELRRCENVPIRHAGANSAKGLWFIHDYKQETDRCASRRLPR